MEVYGACWSDIGQRKVNQDAVLYKDYEQDGQHFAICAVCDGIGGLEHGERASSYLAYQIEEWHLSVTEWLDISRQDSRVLFSHLKDAAELWNEGVLALCREDGIRTGSTMSVWMLLRDYYYIIHVGDSRIYRFSGGLEQLTVDDTVIRTKSGRQKKFLHNFMGKSEELCFQAVEDRLYGGEFFLVCSDGFYHLITEKDAAVLYKNCKNNKELDIRCRKIVQEIAGRGERDNISLGIVFVEK